MQDRNPQFLRLRAVCALFALCLSWLGIQLETATVSAAVCSSACCGEQSHCCCRPRRASNQKDSTQGTKKIEAAEVAPSCPQGCLASRFSTSSFSRELLYAASRRSGLFGLRIHHTDGAAVAFGLFHPHQSSPRAPPTLSI